MNQRAILVTMLVLGACGRPDRRAAETGDSSTLSPERLAAVQAIDEIDAMRSGLAAGVSELDRVDQATFAQVCKPVGARLKQTAAERGWDIRQVAVKYRNPAHAPDPEAEALFPRFELDDSLDSLWIRSDGEGASGWRYLRRITVEPACLACHGQRDARPEFISQNYLDDRAYGFEAGDLRGLYSVFVPDRPAPGDG